MQSLLDCRRLLSCLCSFIYTGTFSFFKKSSLAAIDHTRRFIKNNTLCKTYKMCPDGTVLIVICYLNLNTCLLWYSHTRENSGCKSQGGCCPGRC